MKVINILDLHARTGRWVRNVRKHGEIHITDNGRIVAKIVPVEEPEAVPICAPRAISTFPRLSSEKPLREEVTAQWRFPKTGKIAICEFS